MLSRMGGEISAPAPAVTALHAAWALLPALLPLPKVVRSRFIFFGFFLPVPLRVCVWEQRFCCFLFFDGTDFFSPHFVLC